ncbi:MAG: hypothetical protein ACRAUW_10415 [Aeromonas sp.]|uniref:hypothetical protein n=1 Tax=Aeromonas sp. TaxID=647 RepID=UPI003D6A622B
MRAWMLSLALGVKERCDTEMLIRQQKEKAKDALKNGTAHLRNKAENQLKKIPRQRLGISG